MESVVFKGSRNGISMVINSELEFEELCMLIKEKLLQAKDFLGDRKSLTINSNERSLNEGEQLALKILLRSLDFEVTEFVSKAEKLEEEETIEIAEEVSAGSLGGNLSTQKDKLETYYADGSTLIIRKNIRSGQSIDFDGTLIIFGDVNAGAEIRATGHILVMGTMRGLAHAGFNNNEEAVVYAGRLLPIQLRIADLIARAPDNETQESNHPEIARISEGHLLIESVF